MTTVHVGRTRVDRRSAATVVDVAGHRIPVGMRVVGDRIRPPRALGDVWLPLAIFPAMRLGLPIVLEDAVSPTRLHGIREVQRLLATWDPTLQVQPIEAPVSTRGSRRSAPPIQLMTGGVDSAFALLDNPEATDLVYMHDLDLEPAAVRTEVATMLASLQRETGRRVLRVDSDVRRVVEPYGDWLTQTHLAVLASVATFVAGARRSLHVPSALPYESVIPNASHPMLDAHYATDDLRVMHVGAHVDRFQKVRALSRDDVLLRHLRVCYRSHDALNCSACFKCTRTMASLEVCGVLDRAVTFTRPWTPELHASQEVFNDVARAFEVEIRDAARDAGRTDVADVSDAAIARYDARV
ncbi:hypothetical protein [Agrococcus jejuensis]|uniref:7-cyano-7-deazaguanine synthase (Queuosine biosynthesis) n=1 Tax=Agrococcus jejuensis TaxID=399736 RepID=A0A1G8GEY1_9MICO|nr:hypothetical protein [Agrococcus jejuensis]SDH92847.1 hypothetical protein SAMN04489720_2896 [Agrococcus jejuensis]